MLHQEFQLKALPKYIFRGTTIEFPGNPNCRNYGYSCTSRHPGKATLFALDCYRTNPDSAVVYVSLVENYRSYDITANVIEKKEDEVVYEMPPLEFYPLCLGYVPVREMQKVLNELGHPVYDIARYDNLSRLCDEIRQVSAKEIDKLVVSLEPYLKK